MSNVYGRQVVVPLTNKSGGGVIAGDVVIIDTTNNEAFTTTTTGAYTGGIGVAQETIASNATGRVLVHGYAALVNTSASVTRGNYARTHTVAKQAVDMGSSRGAGAFAQFLTGGTTPTARVFSPDLAAAAGNVASDAIWDAAGDLAVGSGADTAAKLAKGNAGGVLAMGNSAVIWNAGTSFPGSKATNDRYWRTDLYGGMGFHWDGTQWVSDTLYHETFDGITDNAGDLGTLPIARTGDVLGKIALWQPTFNIWLVGVFFMYRVQTTNSGSHFWTITVDNNGSPTAVQSTAANSPDTTYSTYVASGAVASGPFLRWYADKTGTPGSMLFMAASVVYRVIAT